jgi:hypothetical protein
VSSSFRNLDGSTPARLPTIPETRSEWRLRARSGLFDVSVFDGSDAFDLPAFSASLSRVRFQRLTFDVQVPFFLQEAVAALKALYNYPGELLVFEGVGPERIQEIIDQTRAAGVRGSIRFSLNFFETHAQDESFRYLGVQRLTENADARDSLVASNVNRLTESQDLRDRISVGGVFDIGVFDGPWGFQ